MSAPKTIHAPNYPEHHKAVCGDPLATAFAGLIYVTCRACLAPYGLAPSPAARLDEVRSALEVIRLACDPQIKGGSYWPAREWLAARDVYDGDLNDEAVLAEVARVALERDSPTPAPTTEGRGEAWRDFCEAAAPKAPEARGDGHTTCAQCGRATGHEDGCLYAANRTTTEGA